MELTCGRIKRFDLLSVGQFVPNVGRMLPLESLNGLVTFVTAARSGSFTEAADALGVSRSAVGKAIARLETRLGCACSTAPRGASR